MNHKFHKYFCVDKQKRFNILLRIPPTSPKTFLSAPVTRKARDSFFFNLINCYNYNSDHVPVRATTTRPATAVRKIVFGGVRLVSAQMTAGRWL